jgi:hypothetical protein
MSTWLTPTLSTYLRTVSWRKVVYGGGVFVAMGADPSTVALVLAYSTDGGATWTQSPSTFVSPYTTHTGADLAFGAGRFVVIGTETYGGFNPGNTQIPSVTSTDGINWTQATPAISSWGFAGLNPQPAFVTFIGSTFYGVAANNNVAGDGLFTSTDGLAWAAGGAVTGVSGADEQGGIANNGTNFAVKSNGKIVYGASTASLVASGYTPRTGEVFDSVVFGATANKFLTFDYNQAVTGQLLYSSTDGNTWTGFAGPTGTNIGSSTNPLWVDFANGNFYVFIADNAGALRFFSSPDLSIWTEEFAPAPPTGGSLPGYSSRVAFSGSNLAVIDSGELIYAVGQSTVPNVVGDALATGEAVIVAAGLTVGTTNPQFSATTPYGIIISQNPAGGTVVSSGFPVNLVWSDTYTTPTLSGSIPNPLVLQSTLNWTQSTGASPATGYDIYRNGVSIARVGAVLTYTDNVPSAGSYTYQVAAYVSGTDASLLSNSVTLIFAPVVVGFVSTIFDEAIFGAYFGGQLNLVEFTYMPGRTPFVEGATNLIINRYKQEPGDVRARGVDFTQFVVPGELLQTVSVEGISAQGVPQQLTNPMVTPLVVSNLVIDPVTNLIFGYTVSGGQNGIEYTIQFETTTNIQTTMLEEIFSINILVEDSFP